MLALDVIEHLHADGQLLSELRRVLAPGGLALLAAPNRETSWKGMRRLLGLPSESDPDHKREYVLEQFEAMVADRGLVVRDVRTVVYDSPWYGVHDLLGALSPRYYRWWVKRKHARAVAEPGESTGWRFVLEKSA